jgi:hypothetical protein
MRHAASDPQANPRSARPISPSSGACHFRQTLTFPLVYLQGLRAGRSPNYGARIFEHVARVRRRERRIEQVVAIVGTALVLGLYLATSGTSLLEGVAAYALVGWCCTFSPSALF